MDRKVTWLIERNVFDDSNCRKLMKIIPQDQQIECKYIPVEGGFVTAIGHKEIHIPDDACVVFYGSINLAKWLFRNKPWCPTVWADFDGALRCKAYYAHWGKYLLQQKYLMLPLGEIPRKLDWLYEMLAVDGKLFFRPDDNAKSFAGEVVCRDKFAEFWKHATFYETPMDAITVVASPEKIDIEWRLIIADNKVITGSRYRLNGSVELDESYPPEAVAFAEEVASSSSYCPAPIYVMDVAKMADGQFKLVKIGAVNTAGLYVADMKIFYQKASEIAIREWMVSGWNTEQ